MMKGLIPVKSKDGSLTLRNPQLNEHYHSLDGAMDESRHVYVDNGLKKISKEIREIRVFELGLGMGYNAFLAAKWAERNSKKINYLTTELLPLDPESLIEEFSGNGFFKDDDLLLLTRIHKAEWEKVIEVSKFFFMKKTSTPIEKLELQLNELPVDMVFYDAFAPSKQPGIWSIQNLQKCYSWMGEGGILSTYCSQGAFKRNLKELGFVVESPPGYGLKREMTMATKGSEA